MIVVTGDILASEASFEELLALSLDHVRRSRAEPGCISHDVHRHAEQPLRLVFVERWADMAALKAHFAVPASQDFARAVRDLAEERPNLAVYEADPLAL